MKLPAKSLRQSNRQKFLDQFSTLWASFNLDLQTYVDTIRISPRLRINTSGVTNQGRAIGFRTFDQRYFAVCGTRVFKSTNLTLSTTSFTEDASTNVPTNCDPLYSDIETFGTTLCVSSANTLWSKVANGSGTGAWTNRRSFSGSDKHKLKYFQKHDRLYWFDTNASIYSNDSGFSSAATTVGNYTCTIPADLGQLYTMETDIDNMWIGTYNVIDSGANYGPQVKPAYILRWDGITANSVFKYPIKAQGVLALCSDDSGIMHAMDTNGALLKFNSGGFEEIGRLPIENDLLTNVQALGYSAFIHPNGFTYTKNGTFKVLVNNLVGDSGSTIKENFPSGIWEFHKDRGFVHVQSASLSDLTTSNITDYAQNRISGVGALYEPNIYSTSASGRSKLICGIDYYSNASTSVSGIFVEDPLKTIQKYGYLVTGWILSPHATEMWDKVYARFRQFLDSSDKIWLKYRTTEASPTEISITWINTTTFSTTTNISGKENYEVEVLQGTGSGKCAHITYIQSADGVYIVTLDETFTGVTTGTAKARLQDWKKVDGFTGQSSEITKFLIDKSSPRIQLKFCMQFTGDDEVFELALINREQEALI